ncbi:MAG TPA: TolC family protein [Cyclobacteriaceae bacterium]|nr:TolC family protein [Cyclobacteriaceae bacterium]
MNVGLTNLTYVLVGFLSTGAFAQQPISLEQAVQTALQKNQLIKSAEYQVEYFRQVKKTSTDIGKLSAMWMHGQYNSLYQDNNFTFVQTLPFPALLGSQIQLGKEQVIGAQKGLVSAQNDLVFEVKSVYYQLLYLVALGNLLQSQDSLYEDFSRASSLRFKTGESNLLEKTTAETQLMEVRNQSRINQADIQIAESRLQALLRNETPVIASDVLRKRELPESLDTVSLAANPQLNYLRQQAAISQRARQVERNRLLPDISVGYFNQTLIGIQNINGLDQFFGASKRFQGFELGLSIPLWFRPPVARAKAAAINEEILKKNADHFQTTLQGTYRQALQELDKNLSSFTYYESSALTNAGLILTQARKAYRGGEIGYIEYLQSLRNAITIKSNYLQSLNQYNQSVVKIEFLLGTI